MSYYLAKPLFLWNDLHYQTKVDYSSLIQVLKGAAGGGYWLLLGDLSLSNRELLSFLGELVILTIFIYAINILLFYIRLG